MQDEGLPVERDERAQQPGRIRHGCGIILPSSAARVPADGSKFTRAAGAESDYIHSSVFAQQSDDR